jgi:hypothetical protein
MEPVLAVEPVIISPRLMPSKCTVPGVVGCEPSNVVRLLEVGRSDGSHLDVERALVWTRCVSFWAATLNARLITAAATANLTLISPPKCTYRILDPSSIVSSGAAPPAASTNI